MTKAKARVASKTERIISKGDGENATTKKQVTIAMNIQNDDKDQTITGGLVRLTTDEETAKEFESGQDYSIEFKKAK